ncbi:MAG: 50S ribosomal protein L4 [Chitinispirillaceae bacterium]
MKAKIYLQDGTVKGEMDLPEEVFAAEVNQHLMHEVVTSYLANQRQGTAKAKGRSEVSGGGRKPFRQKGTGRARAGSNTSPVWVRGGKAFGPEPRDYYRTIPRKMRKAALRSALSVRAGDEAIRVVQDIQLEAPKTKDIVALFKGMEILNSKILLVIDTANRNAYLSSRNIKNLKVKGISEINTYDVLNSENIVFGAETLVEKTKEVVAQ